MSARPAQPDHRCCRHQRRQRAGSRSPERRHRDPARRGGGGGGRCARRRARPAARPMRSIPPAWSTPSMALCCPAARCSGSMRPPASPHWLDGHGRGFAFRDQPQVCPVVPAAALFDLTNGGNKDWGDPPPYRALGIRPARRQAHGLRARQCRRRPRRPGRALQGRARQCLGCRNGGTRRRPGGGQFLRLARGPRHRCTLWAAPFEQTRRVRRRRATCHSPSTTQPVA